jgi:hypothetical protein
MLDSNMPEDWEGAFRTATNVAKLSPTVRLRACPNSKQPQAVEFRLQLLRANLERCIENYIMTSLSIAFILCTDLD